MALKSIDSGVLEYAMRRTEAFLLGEEAIRCQRKGYRVLETLCAKNESLARELADELISYEAAALRLKQAQIMDPNSDYYSLTIVYNDDTSKYESYCLSLSGPMFHSTGSTPGEAVYESRQKLEAIIKPEKPA